MNKPKTDILFVFLQSPDNFIANKMSGTAVNLNKSTLFMCMNINHITGGKINVQQENNQTQSLSLKKQLVNHNNAFSKVLQPFVNRMCDTIGSEDTCWYHANPKLDKAILKKVNMLPTVRLHVKE